MRCALGVGRAVPAGEARRASTRRGARSKRWRSGVTAKTDRAEPGRRSRSRDLQRPRLVPAPAVAPGRRGAADVLRSVLGPIEASEGHYGGELMRSLEAFIEENGQWERAARRLYCHRHTLRYRIRRVEELTGRRPATAPGPDRILARAPRTGAGRNESRGAIRGQGRRVSRRADPGRRAGAGRRGARGVCAARRRARAQRSPTRRTRPRAPTILADAAAVFAQAEMIVKVKEPQASRGRAARAPGHVLFTYLHLAADAGLTQG